MHHLGQTRSSHQRDHLLQTPDTFVRAKLPGMRDATAIVHAGPAMGARFTEYTVELEPGGAIELGAAQSFVFVLDGFVAVTAGGEEQTLSVNQYAWLPPDRGARVGARQGARALVIEKFHAAHNSVVPAYFWGDERVVSPQRLPGEDAVEVRTLIPDDLGFDCAVNTLTFPPGASLPMVEVHVMEHGLLMLQGEGIYRLSDHWYPVQAGDFIWMAPYCPQWFGALGKKPARYLIYKDWNRHPLNP